VDWDTRAGTVELAIPELWLKLEPTVLILATTHPA